MFDLGINSTSKQRLVNKTTVDSSCSFNTTPLGMIFPCLGIFSSRRFIFMQMNSKLDY